MIEWIKKHLDPPGNERKNWRSIFSFIGRVFGIVKDDAVKAHNAFFPYLCDSDKLRQHGDSLIIPELPFDTEKEYRDRVATASFYLMRAGERAYIMEQLKERFGDRFLVIEEFLSIHTKVTELTDKERVWVLNLFDSLVDPNIYLELSERYCFTEEFIITDALFIIVQKQISDNFKNGLKYNGRGKYDGHTLNPTVDADYDVAVPFKYCAYRIGIIDELTVGYPQSHDTETAVMDDAFSAGMRFRRRFNGTYKYNGVILYNGNVLIPM